MVISECKSCSGFGRLAGDEYPCGAECCGFELVECELCQGTGTARATNTTNTATSEQLTQISPPGDE